jgi:hypothetical protein
MASTRTPRAVSARSTKRRSTTVAPMIARDPAAPPRNPDDRDRRIAERAYLLAEQRGFAPGGELADWLAAERAVDAERAGPAPSRD